MRIKKFEKLLKLRMMMIEKYVEKILNMKKISQYNNVKKGLTDSQLIALM